MKKYSIQYLTFVCCFLLIGVFSACKNEMQQKIVGKWYAAQLIECDEIIPIERENVNLELLENGKYVFNSTLNIHEEGDYNLKDSFLYTKDLLKNEATIKVVKIVKLNPDTLELAMNYKGKEQILSLLREVSLPDGQKKTIRETTDSSANIQQKDTNNNNATIAAATTAVAATALAATTTSPDTKQSEEKKATTKEKEKKDSKKETKKSKREQEREKKEREKEKKEREKEKKKREKARKEREKKEKEREKKEREKAKKKKKK